MWTPPCWGQNGARVMCFIDEPYVVSLAEARRATRAEVAVDHALALPGPKLMVVGSAPTALHRLVQRRQSAPMTDVCVLTALSGFASAIQLKERLWESDLASIVVRGQKRWRRRYRYVAQRHPGRGAMKHSRAKLL